MSFKKMEEVAHSKLHERSCIMLYNFTPVEMKQLQNVARMMGLKDQIILGPQHSQNTIRTLLDQGDITTDGTGIKEKALLFNEVPSLKMNAFIEALKKCRMNRPLIAVITETSIEWTLEELLMNLCEERRALKQGQFTGHK